MPAGGLQNRRNAYNRQSTEERCETRHLPVPGSDKIVTALT